MTQPGLATRAARTLFALWPLVISGMVTALGWALYALWKGLA